MSRSGWFAWVLVLGACTSGDEVTDDTDTEVDSAVVESGADTADTDESDVFVETSITIDTDTGVVDSDGLDTDTDTDLPACQDGWARDCNQRCFSTAIKGDGFCDDGPVPQSDFDCEAHAFDDGDCQADTDTDLEVCPFPGEVQDCNRECFSQTVVGDGICDMGPAGTPDFNCGNFSFDGGDCEPDTDDTDVADSSDTDLIPLPCPDAFDIRDCDGHCYPLGWLGDSACDDGTQQPWGNPDFACARLSYDDGDCPLPDTDTDTDQP